MPEARFHVNLQQVHQAGGDFYDVIDHGHGRVDYIVADTTGHDLSSSFWTLALKTLLSEYSSLLLSPLDSFYLINRSLLRILPEGVFFTACQVQMDRPSGHAFVLSAGHPPLLRIPYDEPDAANLVYQSADVLGAFADASFSRVGLPIRPKDRLFLFSDGLIDLFGSSEEGLQKLVAAARSCQTKPLASAVKDIVNSQRANKVLQDDVLLMGIEV
jgi:phosphoserine phosphatase RsbU/P